MVEEEGKRGRRKAVTLLVGVNLGKSSRELLTWVLMKVAQAGDHVIVVQVLPSPTGMAFHALSAIYVLYM